MEEQRDLKNIEGQYKVREELEDRTGEVQLNDVISAIMSYLCTYLSTLTTRSGQRQKLKLT